jgi:hypothetical protein
MIREGIIHGLPPDAIRNLPGPAHKFAKKYWFDLV